MRSAIRGCRIIIDGRSYGVRRKSDLLAKFHALYIYIVSRLMARLDGSCSEPHRHFSERAIVRFPLTVLERVLALQITRSRRVTSGSNSISTCKIVLLGSCGKSRYVRLLIPGSADAAGLVDKWTDLPLHPAIRHCGRVFAILPLPARELVSDLHRDSCLPD